MHAALIRRWQNLLPKYSVVILVISTTGQGEFPKNTRKFWKSLLRKRLPPGYLDHVSFTTFGLGDTSYPKYVLPDEENDPLLMFKDSIGLLANFINAWSN